MTRIGVVVPCYRYHIPHLGRLLRSLVEQTRLPDQVVVSCSSTLAEEMPYKKEDYPFSLEIYCTEEVKNAAENRNRGVRYLGERVDLVSFFDADDWMHPVRLALIEKAFLHFPSTKIVLHDFHTEHEDNFEGFPTISISDEEAIRFLPGILSPGNTQCVVLSFYYQAQAGIHHAQATVSLETAKRFPFWEDASSARREDSIFCHQVVVDSGSDTMYLPYKLSKYSHEGQTYRFSLP